MPDGRLAYRLKTPWRDGTTHVVMERRELLERLAPLIPPPRAHQVRYHGVLAPCASGRDRVVPAAAAAGATEATRSCSSASESDIGSTRAADRERDDETLVARASSDVRAERSESLGRRIAWADLLKRVFEVDALRCPGCGGRMRLLAAITEPGVARRILDCLSLSSRAPPPTPATELGLGPFVGCDEREPALSKPDGDPGFDFDQSQAEDQDSNQGS